MKYENMETAYEIMQSLDCMFGRPTKKAKKKDIVAVDHSRIAYEPFRKEFYHPPPEVADMTDEDAELLRLELDGIKIRGIDCPRPITKWSHCGLPSSWYV